MSTSVWIGSRGLLHTGSKQPAMPASKPQPVEQPAGEPVFPNPAEPEPEKIDPAGPKHRPRRKPGISDAEEFMRIQQAWANKLPLDEDPTIPKEIIMRPVRTHTQAMMRKIISNDTLIRMQRKYDWSAGGVRRYLDKKMSEQNIIKQRFIPMRHGVLGPDLATAHFVTHRGGRVKFVGHAEWFTSDEPLPKKFDENYLIEKVDATSKCLPECLS